MLFSKVAVLNLAVYLHTCLLLQLYCFCSSESSKSIGRSGTTDSLSKVPDSHIYEKNNKQTGSFWFFQRVAKAFVPELTEATFVLKVMRMHERNMQNCSWKYSACMRKTWSKKEFLWSFPKRTLHHEAANRIDLQNQGAQCKNIL